MGFEGLIPREFTHSPLSQTNSDYKLVGKSIIILIYINIMVLP